MQKAKKKKTTQRIQVALRSEVFEVVTKTAELTGQSRSKVIAELLEACYPPMVRTVALLEAANDAPDEVKQGLVDTMEGIEKELGYVVNLSDREAERLQKDALEVLEKSSQRPPPTNRGVQISNPLKNKRKKMGKKTSKTGAKK